MSDRKQNHHETIGTSDDIEQVRYNYLADGDFVYRTRPVNIVAAQGSCLIGSGGERWIDLEAANGGALFGYDVSITNNAAAEWSCLPAVPSFVETETRIRFAQALGTRIHKSTGMPGKLAFELGGAQGIELAIRIAAAFHPERRTILVLQGAYHGRSLFLSNLSSSLRYRESLSSIGYRIVRLPVPAFMHADAEQMDLHTAMKACMSLAEQMFLQESYGVGRSGKSDACALLFEPVLNVSGLIDPGIEYLDYICQLARRVGCLTIADEVFSGYYRMGTFLASESLSIAPDMIVLGKALSNATVPLSAVWAREHLVAPEVFPRGTYSTTFSNSPLRFMVANDVLRRVNKVKSEDVDRIAAFLRELCLRTQTLLPNSVKSTGVRGLTAYIEFSEEAIVESFMKRCREGIWQSSGNIGLLFANTGAARKRLLVHPPITLSSEEIKLAFDVINNVREE